MLALGGTRERPGPLPGSVGLEPDLASQLQPLRVNLFLSTSLEQHPYLLPAWTYAQPDPKYVRPAPALSPGRSLRSRPGFYTV